MDNVNCEFIAVGGNRHPSAADWSSSGILAYGAGRCIALCNPDRSSRQGVYATLKGHTDNVNAVRFLPDREKDAEIIVSGSVDQTLRFWRCNSDGIFTLVTTVEDIHKGSINSIAVCGNTVASASADGIIAIFSLSISPDNLQVTHLQTLTTKPKFFPLCIALGQLPGASGSLILAAGGSTTTISIYISPSDQPDFKHQATLSGHENWVRSLAFNYEDPSQPTTSDVILASASADKYIRLWRLHSGEELPAATANSDSKTYGLSTRLSNKAHMLRLPEKVWSITFEALLMGHEDWIYTANWRPNARSRQEVQLLSCSADNSLSIWAEDEATGVWVITSRFGEISDMKGSTTATGSAGGLWNGLWSPDGNTVAALTKSGSWRMWKYDGTADRWWPAVGLSGHVKEVAGISWAPEDGGYLLSTSLDQTTRLFSRWTAEGGKGTWHEFSRPQIHGYDINCIATVGQNRFVSGADEKLLRVFDKPRSVATILDKLCNLSTGNKATEELPNTASIPVLGLSNKSIDPEVSIPMYDGHEPDIETVGQNGEEVAVPLDPAATKTATSKTEIDGLLPSDSPPFEDQLARHTLWPEAEKLYGHGYEISCLAADPAGKVIATACKASTVEHAVVRLYDTTTWREIKPPLNSHSLTVTRMAFSRDGRMLLSVGRDRAFSVFEKTGEEEEAVWELKERKEKAHARIVYDCAFLPTEDNNKVFVTVARDKSLKLWTPSTSSSWECAATVKMEQPVTAVDCLGDVVDGNCWIAVGLEDGGVAVFVVRVGEWSRVEEKGVLERGITPDRAVTQVRWRPGEVLLEGGRRRTELAVASEDWSVRVYSLGLR